MKPFELLIARIPVLHRHMLGMAMALLAYSLLGLQDAAVKWLVARLPVWQVLLVRSCVLVLGCLIVGGGRLVHHAAKTPSRTLLVRRGAVTLTAWVCYFTAARYLMLGELVTLYFTAPVIITLLSAPLLGERVGWARWVAVGFGFAGTLLAAGPSGLSMSPATLLVLFGAFLWAYGVILTRQIARRESSLLQMFCNNCFFFVLTGVGTAFTWQTPDVSDVWLLLLVSALAGFGQFCLFESARHAPASVTAPLGYTTLAWAFMLGFLVWGDIPRPAVFLAAALIVAAGLLLLVWEYRSADISKSPTKMCALGQVNLQPIPSPASAVR
jgi:drug/metabolite transporter (DMT)-like permease